MVRRITPSSICPARASRAPSCLTAALVPLNPPTRPLRPAPRALPARARPAPSAAPRLVRLLLGLRRRDAAEVEELVQKAHAGAAVAREMVLDGSLVPALEDAGDGALKPRNRRGRLLGGRLFIDRCYL